MEAMVSPSAAGPTGHDDLPLWPLGQNWCARGVCPVSLGLALYLVVATPVPAAAQLSSRLRAGDIVVMADPQPISGSIDLLKVDRNPERKRH